MNKKMFNGLFYLIIIGILLLLIFIALLPPWVTKWSWISLNVDKPNEIGDTVGGIMGPIVASVGVIVTFLAFWMQYKANEKQFQKFDDQENDTQIERFEYKFYELLKIHRDNVAEFEIVRHDGKENLRGRRVFVEMFEELELLYRVVKRTHQGLFESGMYDEKYYTEEEIFNLSYIIYFNGFDKIFPSQIPTEKPEFNFLPTKYNNLLIESLKNLDGLRNHHKTNMPTFSIKANETDVHFFKPQVTYRLFAGHNSRLGHYFRSLFQLVHFVISYDENIIKDKYSYVKTIRSQLSNHEQLLLYYNSLSVFGSPWIDNNYLNEWRLIKNIPLNLANFYINPKRKFGTKNSKGELIFEIDEISKRMNK